MRTVCQAVIKFKTIIMFQSLYVDGESNRGVTLDPQLPYFLDLSCVCMDAHMSAVKISFEQ